MVRSDDMVIIQTPATEFSERPFHKPIYNNTEERDLSGLKAKIGTARDFALFVGASQPELWLTENRSLFIRTIQAKGCMLPERSIDRAIRSAKPFANRMGIFTDDDTADRMEADHRIAFGEMR